MKSRLLALWMILGILGATLPIGVAEATVSTTAPRNDYIGNGATATYNYTFRIFAATDLRVTKRDTSNVETALSYPADYSVTGTNSASGGTITLTAGNLPTDYRLTIRFDRTPRQSTDLRNQGSFFPEVHEDKFDELTRYVQQVEDVIDRSIHLPETEAGTSAATTLPAANSRASKFLAFDASGNPVASAGGFSTPTVTAYATTLLDDTTAVQARQTLLLDKKGADIASAATIDLDTATGDLIDVTGTTTITAITLAEGVEKTVRFTGALTLTHGASLVLPGSASITTAVGDFAVMRGYSGGVVRCVQYQRANGAPVPLGAVGTEARVTSSTAVTYGAPAGYLWGLTLSNNSGDATNDIDIALGEASSSSTTYANRVVMSLTSTLTKQLDATWVAGTNQGGRSSSQALANGTWHVCLIRIAGVDDVGFDTSATCANLITDHSATHVRRIGSILRESAAIVAFTQTGDVFRRQSAVTDVNATNPGTAAVTRTLSVPTGIVVEAIVGLAVTGGAGGQNHAYLSPLAASDEAASSTRSQVGGNQSAGGMFSGWAQVQTNTSSQIRSRVFYTDAGVAFSVATWGWNDARGRVN